MEKRDFFDALEYWASPMTPGSVAGFDGFVRTVAKMDDEQRAMMVRYLRSDITYERFLQTRYWHAIRLKVISDRKHLCEVCSEKRPDVEIHHRTYDHRGEEYAYLMDLRLLYGRCHNMAHELKAMIQAD
jgi:hypothetical protein